MEINDSYAQVHYNLANSLRDLGRIDEAIREYKSAIEISPDFQYPYNNLLSIYVEARDQEAVDELLKEMEIIFFREENFLYTKGAVYYYLGRYREAVI